MSGWLVGTSALTSGRSMSWGEETIRDEWGRARAAALSAISGGSTAVSGSPCTGAPRTANVGIFGTAGYARSADLDTRARRHYEGLTRLCFLGKPLICPSAVIQRSHLPMIWEIGRAHV